MKLRYRLTKAVSGSLLTIGFACAAYATSPEILVLSNRADLVSGGDALVEIKVPAYLNPASGSRSMSMAEASPARLRSVPMADSTD